MPLQDIKTIGVIGSGLMGNGIVQVAAASGSQGEASVAWAPV